VLKVIVIYSIPPYLQIFYPLRATQIPGGAYLKTGHRSAGRRPIIKCTPEMGYFSKKSHFRWTYQQEKGHCGKNPGIKIPLKCNLFDIIALKIY
jgi:hypothetical protein